MPDTRFPDAGRSILGRVWIGDGGVEDLSNEQRILSVLCAILEELQNAQKSNSRSLLEMEFAARVENRGHFSSTGMIDGWKYLQRQGQTPIPGYAVSTRMWNVCRRHGVHTFEELAARTPAEFTSVRQCGEATLNEARQLLAKHGMKFRGEA